MFLVNRVHAKPVEKIHKKSSRRFSIIRAIPEIKLMLRFLRKGQVSYK